MKFSQLLTTNHQDQPLWQGNNAWNPWQPKVRAGGEHLYDGHNSWQPWGGVESVADMDEYRADKVADTKAALIVMAALILMLVHYFSGSTGQ